MAIIPDFDMRAIRQLLTAKHQELEEKAFRTLQYVGEKFVREARLMGKTQGGFGDVTGNLRSSIGYVIFKDNVVILSNFKASSRGTDKKTGIVVGRSFADQLGEGKGYQLVGVAGMMYARYVEDKGLNVISYQADLALIDLREMVSKIRIR